MRRTARRTWPTPAAGATRARSSWRGAVGDPPQGALFVFRVAGPAEVEAFAEGDPYVAAGIVTGRDVQPWNVVIS